MKKHNRFAVGIVAIAAFWILAACGGYGTPDGRYYTEEQMRQYCSHLRPGSADYQRFDCANRLAPTP